MPLCLKTDNFGVGLRNIPLILGSTLQYTAFLCNLLQCVAYAVTHCNIYIHILTYVYSIWRHCASKLTFLASDSATCRSYSAALCNTLQLYERHTRLSLKHTYAATHCNVYIYTHINIFYLAPLRLKTDNFGVGFRNVPLILGCTLVSLRSRFDCENEKFSKVSSTDILHRKMGSE